MAGLNPLISTASPAQQTGKRLLTEARDVVPEEPLLIKQFGIDAFVLSQ
jgi:hypothetical protein